MPILRVPIANFHLPDTRHASVRLFASFHMSIMFRLKSFFTLQDWFMGFSWAGGIKFEPLGRCGALWNGPLLLWPCVPCVAVGTMVPWWLCFPILREVKESFSFDSHEFWWSIWSFIIHLYNIVIFTTYYLVTIKHLFLFFFEEPRERERGHQQRLGMSRLAVSLCSVRGIRAVEVTMPLPAMAQSLRIVVTRTENERHGELVAIYFCEVVKWSSGPSPLTDLLN